MAQYSSLSRLNTMNELFTKWGNKKLDRGEVDALAAFYGGVSKSSQGKIRDRLVEIYQTSKFSKGQKGRFLNQLQVQGFTVGELENLDPNTVKGFLAMPKGEQFDSITSLANEWSDEGFTRDIAPSKVAAGAKPKIKAELNTIEDGIKDNHGEETFVGGPNYRAIYLEETEDGKGKGLVGYELEIPIYTGDHDVDEAHFFNLNGEWLGSEYRGE